MIACSVYDGVNKKLGLKQGKDILFGLGIIPELINIEL